MTGELDRELERGLESRARAGLLRRLEKPAQAEAIDFATNDALGFARSGVLVPAAREALERHGTGGRAARLLGGGCALDFEAEEAAASWLHAEAALLFPSGFQTNLGVIASLAGPGDAIFSDRANHASLRNFFFPLMAVLFLYRTKFSL